MQLSIETCYFVFGHFISLLFVQIGSRLLVMCLVNWFLRQSVNTECSAKQ